MNAAATTTDTPQTTPELVTDEMIAQYQRDGFIRIPGIITKAEAARYHDAAQARSAASGKPERAVFSQTVNVWEHDAVMRELTLHRNVAGVAQKLATVPMRLWHDHILTKRANNGAYTEFHQDQAYWPHADSVQPISAWIALVDVPAERGCMSFIPGSHALADLESQNLSDMASFYEKAPEMEFAPRVTLPLRAGDCTFHHGRCAHSAFPNRTDVDRVAHVIIYMDQCTTYSGRGHVCTDPLELEAGVPLDQSVFPTVASIMAGKVDHPLREA